MMSFHLRLYLPNEPKNQNISCQLTPNSSIHTQNSLVPAHIPVWKNQIYPRLFHKRFHETIWLMKQFSVIMFSVVHLHWFMAAARYERYASVAESFMRVVPSGAAVSQQMYNLANWQTRLPPPFTRAANLHTCPSRLAAIPPSVAAPPTPLRSKRVINSTLAFDLSTVTGNYMPAKRDCLIYTL